MKTLHLYLLRQVFLAVVMTVAVFTFVLLLGNVLREIMAVLVNQQASMMLVGRAVALLIPFVLVFALPMGLLTGTLLVFGRFSADQELTAVRASGVSLLALITPILLLSIVLTGVTGWINLSVAPRARVAYKSLLYQMGMSRPTTLISENQFIRDFPGFIIYVGRVEGELLRNLVIYQMDTNAPPPEATEASEEAAAKGPRVTAILAAPEARVHLDVTNQLIQLELPEVEGVYLESWQPGGGQNQVLDLPARLKPPGQEALKLSEMTFAQLMHEYYEQRRLGIEPTPVTVHLHRQVVSSFACLGFTLIGIPLGVRAHRRETSAGIGIALLLVLVYYAFLILGQAWETRPERFPHLILWIPNFLFQGMGAVLLWRVNRRG